MAKFLIPILYNSWTLNWLTPLPAKIYANEGAAQLIFLKGNEEPEITYEQRNGIYMKQTGITLPKV